MTFRTIPALFLFLLVMTIGCASQEVVRERPVAEPKKEQKSPLSKYEATLNPSDYDDEVTTLPAQPKQNSTDTSQALYQLPSDSMVVVEDVQLGFRIQLYSSASIDDITQIKLDAQTKITEDSLYVVFDAPVYKVRVGDFTNRYEANQRLSQIMNLGFRDAWIVPDRVVVRRLVPASQQPQK